MYGPCSIARDALSLMEVMAQTQRNFCRPRVGPSRDRPESAELRVECRVRGRPSSEPRSLLELKGLGKEHWEGLDGRRHVENERAAWDR